MVNNLVFSWPFTCIFPWVILGAHGTFKFHMELLRTIKLGIFLFLFGLLYLYGFSLRQAIRLTVFSSRIPTFFQSNKTSGQME